MALGTDYVKQDCSLARALEIVGERWTMLILRDCFFGVRRFSDFQVHLDISKAVLADRLAALVAAGLLTKSGSVGRSEYLLTEDGEALWPTLFALTQWGDRVAAVDGPRRVFTHVDCGGPIGTTGQCGSCREVPTPSELLMHPGPGARGPRRTDAVSRSLRGERRLLQPLTGGTAT